MAFSDDAVRLLRENLQSAYSKVSAIAVALLAWTLPYKAAEYLGVANPWHRWLAVLCFYCVVGISTLVVFLYKSLHQAYEDLGPAIPTQKALAELAAKFIGFEKKEMKDDCLMKADGASISVNDVVLFAHTSRVTKIEHTSSTPSVPSGVSDSLVVTAEPRNEGGMRISSEVLKSTSTLCLWSINFTPELAKGSSVGFRYRMATAKGSFATSLAEMKRRGLSEEHYSHQISFPTALFHVKVTFDAEVTPTNIPSGPVTARRV